MQSALHLLRVRAPRMYEACSWSPNKPALHSSAPSILLLLPTVIQRIHLLVAKTNEYPSPHQNNIPKTPPLAAKSSATHHSHHCHFPAYAYRTINPYPSPLTALPSSHFSCSASREPSPHTPVRPHVAAAPPSAASGNPHPAILTRVRNFPATSTVVRGPPATGATARSTLKVAGGAAAHASQ